jgi:shikimate kinase
MTPRVILIGPPGAGKTTIGKEISAALSVQFLDTDTIIEKQTGMTISEIFVDKGEPFFRELEAKVVIDAVDTFDGVLALGGGAPLSALAQECLKKTTSPIIYLDVSLATAAPRIGFNRDRPLLLGNPRAKWNELLETRRPLYEGTATKVVNVDHGTPKEIAQIIISEISGGN